MREILFRGKRIYKNEWVYGNLVIDNRGELHIVRPEDVVQDGHHIRDDSDLPMFFEQETFGQYTGLKDKNGKRIFEGDIVHYLYEPGKGYWNSDQNSVIEWRSTGFYMRGIMGTNKYACSTGWLVSIPHGDGKCFEVIGNIHDNPELLEGGEADG